ncbi:ABC transporter substrate-binding protein [Pseudoalteromonas sp. MMG013]|uniref:heme/hemin ABC transporter substrate-binding protein n=1 Tax=Pseudoalteromonas sp. MMG013 TaxID=2822687 RepID=UPI001B364F54|nr:ABC transporter substrate-binding protein [Pseudoalteromonas sp. MMG013]MBQ4860547.1 ABC transporter substrate-binding protein [Pseudoalteromonas sp. MMG013]
MKVKAWSCYSVFCIYFVSLFILFPSIAAAQNYQRVVVSGGSITEIIYALGEQDRIIGVDSTSVFPAIATKKAQVGYVRNINVEGVLSLNPDLLLGEADTGPDKVVKQLQDTGLKTHIFSNNDNFHGIETKISQIAKLLNVEQKGQMLNTYIQADRQALKHILSQTQLKPNVLFVLSLKAGQPLVSGAGTSAHEVITAAGGHNIAGAHFTGWKPLSTESAMAMNPDIIVTMGRHGANKSIDVSKITHFKYSNAVKNKQVFTFDGSYLLGMSPRTPQAVVELAKAIHANVTYPAGYQLRAAQTSHNSKAL